MTRDEQACEHGMACIYVHVVYVRNYLVVCIVWNRWTVKLASQCFFRFTHRLYVPFRTYKWQNIMHCIQKRCKLTVVVLLFTGATYNTKALSHNYSNTTRYVIYRSTHVCRMRLIILKATINDNYVRGLTMIILVPGGARFYENSNIPT